jgi:VanZ family protein
MPRYFTMFDIATNLVGYFPLGFLVVLALHVPRRPWLAIALATLSAMVLSTVLEAAQTYLPSRVASNLDVICNTAGAFFGAVVGARLACPMAGAGPARRPRHGIARAVVAHPGESGIAVVRQR